MKVEFTHTPDDYVEAATARNPVTPRGNTVLAKILFVLGAVIMLSTSLYLSWHSSGNWMLAIIFVAAFVYIWGRITFAPWKETNLRRTFAADGRNAQTTTVEIADSGFQYLTPTWKCHIEWRVVKCFFQTESLLLLSDNLGVTYYIPSCAFASPEIQQQFARYVENHLVPIKSGQP